MSYLIDTNIISETSKMRPDPLLVQWFDQVSADDLYLSVLSVGEIRNGVERLSPGKRKNDLVLWLEYALPSWFGKNILPISQEIAEKWGYLNAHHKKSLPAIDSLLAATALTHNLKIVTRNSQDFVVQGLEVINPFNA
jgi:predicted nucleic acid-binding protein